MTKTPLIVHVFDGFRIGGTEVRTCKIINSLRGAYRHVVVSSTGDLSARTFVDPSIDVQYVHPLAIQSRFRLVSLWRIARLLRSFSPQLLIAYEWGAIDWVMANAFARLCPAIMMIEGFEEAELFAQKKARVFLRRIFYKRCQRVVACSKVLARIAVGEWRLEPRHVLHIPNGINCSIFHPAQGETRGPSGEVVIGIVASLIKLKNHDRLLRSMAELHAAFPLLLYIVGDGPERERLAEECQRLAIADKVRFTGILSDPSPILRKLDIFCLASDTEQMPLSVLEAMACRLPIVSTEVGDVKEMVAEENRRFIVNADCASAYTEALRELCRDGALRQELGQANYQRCRALYDESLMFRRHRDLYAEVIASA